MSASGLRNWSGSLSYIIPWRSGSYTCFSNQSEAENMADLTPSLWQLVITTDQPLSQALNKGIHHPGFLQKILQIYYYSVLWCVVSIFLSILLVYQEEKDGDVLLCLLSIYTLKEGCFSPWKSGGKIYDFFTFHNGQKNSPLVYCQKIKLNYKTAHSASYSSYFFRIEVVVLSILPVAKVLSCLLSSCFYVTYFLSTVN